MIQDNDAIKKAMDYFNGLPQDYLGSPEQLRLEPIERKDDIFVILLSYLSQTKFDKSNDVGVSLQKTLFSRQRYFKEIVVDAEIGNVLRMTDPVLQYVN